jgi:hypothetical protein
MVGINGQHTAIQVSRAAQVAELLNHDGKTENCLEMLGVQGQGPFQIVQGGAVTFGPEKRLCPRVIAFGKIRRMIGQRGARR